MTERILHVLSTPRAEGTPNLVLDWLSAGTDHWQGILVLNSQPANLTERLKSAANAYDEHDLFHLGKRKFPRIARAAYAAVKQHRPDVVICWPTGFSNWVCGGARAAGCRSLLVHSGNPATRGRRADWIARYVMWPLRSLDADVICCSDYVRDSVAAVPGISRRMLHTVYNCTRAVEVSERAEQARAASRNGQNGPVAIMVATLEPHKDHDTLLNALPAVLRRIPNFRVQLAGDGSLRGKLERQAEQLGIEQAVEFLGSRSDVPELLGTADLCVLATTRQEGLGSVLLEAMAAKTPILASDVPACRELLAAGKWGRLAVPSNASLLAEAISEMLISPPARGEIDAAADFAASFTPQRMIQEYLSIAARQPIPSVAILE